MKAYEGDQLTWEDVVAARKAVEEASPPIKIGYDIYGNKYVFKLGFLSQVQLCKQQAELLKKEFGWYNEQHE